MKLEVGKFYSLYDGAYKIKYLGKTKNGREKFLDCENGMTCIIPKYAISHWCKEVSKEKVISNIEASLRSIEDDIKNLERTIKQLNKIKKSL